LYGKPQVSLSDEHQNYDRATATEATKLTIMPGALECLMLYEKKYVETLDEAVTIQ
jgi:hypothetical protein